ncbi:cupin [Actinomycetaceae bacterium WB03_NA08]|uniref:Cupin n=1 Tax=Scrofimicrobium canadense TaxID=2652290 RepID=A0A6N7W6Z2_9ACTO|nr:cupin [Scrofimicrobium canadense]MSS84202.1 cupin [Scrofimicrobium canadense]
MTNLAEVTARNLDNALTANNGRSAELVAHDGVLRQSIIALRAGTRLQEHNSPPAATLQVLSGSVRVEIGDKEQGHFKENELWVLTHERHSVIAVEDCVFLLTTVTSTGEESHG